MVQRKSVPPASHPIDWSHIPSEILEYPKGGTIFAQGEAARAVMFLEKGTVRLAVVSHAGKEAIISIVEAGHFFGEGCLAGQTVRVATAVAMSSCVIRVLDKQCVVQRLHSRRTLADAFLQHMLGRTVRIEADLIDQLFNSTEKRLARTLLLLARNGDHHREESVIPKISQELLAEMVGTTRTRVNFFMNKFKRLGHITYDGAITVRASLWNILLHD